MITIKQELQPIKVPNFILFKSNKPGLKQDGISFKTEGVSVKDLSKDVILQLCEQFKTDLLERADYENE